MPADEAFDIPIIALEGIDGAGKTTLMESLRGDPELSEVLFTGEFQSCVGGLLRDTAGWKRDPILKLFGFPADCAFLFKEISSTRPHPRAIVWDRYVDSALAYREAERRLGRSQYGLKEAKDINASFPPPLKVIYLALSPEQALERKHGDAKLLAEAAQVYEEIAAERGDAYTKIDANQSKEEIRAHAKREILAVLRST
jgi:thymidylate kinase